MTPSLLIWLLRWVCPDLQVRQVTQVPLEVLWTKGIRVLFVDLDNTLTELGSQRISQPVQQWLERAKALGFQVIIVSNAARQERVNKVAQSLGIIGIAAAWKPRRFVFRRYLAWQKFSPQQAAMVGDQLFTDILAGKRVGMFTILVEPLTERRFITGRIQRPLELLALRLLRRYGLLTK